MARAARSARGSKRKSNVITVNFKGVEGKGVVVPEGDYAAKPVEITIEDGQKGQYLKWVFEITRGKYSGKKLFLNTSLSEQSLWNLRGLLEALGQEVPDDEMELDLAAIVADEGEVALTVEHETYENRKQARVNDFQPIDSVVLEDDEDEDEKPASKKSKAKAKDEDDEDEADEDEEDEKPARGRKTKPAAKSSRRGRDEDEDEEEEDDEDEKPARGKKGKASKKSKAVISADDVEDMSEKELEDLIEEHELDVDLDKAKTLSRKRAKVIDALEEAGLYEAA